MQNFAKLEEQEENSNPSRSTAAFTWPQMAGDGDIMSAIGRLRDFAMH